MTRSMRMSEALSSCTITMLPTFSAICFHVELNTHWHGHMAANPGLDPFPCPRNASFRA